MDQKSGYELALDAFEETANALELSAEERTALRQPEEARRMRVSAQRAGGETDLVPAFWVRHNTWKGPARAGFLYRPDVTLEQAQALAMRMSWQWALLDVPLGGAACAVEVDARSLTATAAPRPVCCNEADGAPLTGEAVGLGVFLAVAAACERLRIPLRNARVAVQGFGAAGSATAMLLAEAGALVVGAGDSRGAIYAERGLDVQRLVRRKASSGSVVGFPGSEPITDCELLALKCDVLVATALGNAIHCQNAPVIQARMVAEAAPSLLTPGADRVLQAKGAFLIPDLLCVAGGPAVSYFTLREDATEVYRRLEAAIRRCFDDSLAVAAERRVSLRKALHLLAVGRVAAARRA
jgi:glutamate dehydrogenase/leucine dehydrogenase